WCAISCVITCSKSEYAPVNGMTARFRAKSVTPPVPSLLTSVALVCMKSVWDAYRMIGFRSRNSWFNTFEGRGSLAVVVVDIEMLGLDDLEIEVGVLDLVPAEVLGGQEAGRAQETGE